MKREWLHNKIKKEWLGDYYLFTLIMDGKIIKRKLSLLEYRLANFNIIDSIEYEMYEEMMETYK